MWNETLRLRFDSFWFRKTSGNETTLNRSLMSASSFSKAGPSRRVTRLRTASSSRYPPRRRAYPLSAEPPKKIRQQWTSITLSRKTPDRSAQAPYSGHCDLTFDFLVRALFPIASINVITQGVDHVKPANKFG